MKIAGIIPARYASTRFPGKPLVQIDGISMIERVYRQAQKAASLNKVIVATDDERIADAVHFSLRRRKAGYSIEVGAGLIFSHLFH